MTRKEIVKIGSEFSKNYYSKYHHYVTTTYKYRGEIKTKKTLELTEEGSKILLGVLDTEKVFTCICCKKKVTFNQLEYWGEEDDEAAINDEMYCSICYEDFMGEDL